MGIFDKAKDLAGEHSEQVSQGIDQGGDFIDDKTGGKFSDQIDQGQDFARDQLGLDAQQDEQEAEPNN